MRHDAAKTRGAVRSERIRLEQGIWTEAEKAAYRAHLERIHQIQAKQATKGPALFTQDEDPMQA